MPLLAGAYALVPGRFALPARDLAVPRERHAPNAALLGFIHFCRELTVVGNLIAEPCLRTPGNGIEIGACCAEEDAVFAEYFKVAVVAVRRRSNGKRDSGIR